MEQRAEVSVDEGAAAASDSRSVEHEYTLNWAPILRQLRSSLLVSTYQAGKVIPIGKSEPVSIVGGEPPDLSSILVSLSELYLEARLGWQLTQTLAGRSRIEYLRKEQGGRCRVCGQPLRPAEEDWQIHHRIWRSRGGPDTADNMELCHANCHRQIHVQEGRTKAAASREGRS